jgi:hypothetical protein
MKGHFLPDLVHLILPTGFGAASSADRNPFARSRIVAFSTSDRAATAAFSQVKRISDLAVDLQCAFSRSQQPDAPPGSSVG